MSKHIATYRGRDIVTSRIEQVNDHKFVIIVEKEDEKRTEVERHEVDNEITARRIALGCQTHYEG